MVTEVINLKLDSNFLKDIDAIVKKSNYQNRTEFIRAALRDKVDEVKLREVTASIAHLRGSLKKKITDEDLEQMREEGFKKLSKKFN